MADEFSKDQDEIYKATVLLLEVFPEAELTTVAEAVKRAASVSGGRAYDILVEQAVAIYLELGQRAPKSTKDTLLHRPGHSRVSLPPSTQKSSPDVYKSLKEPSSSIPSMDRNKWTTALGRVPPRDLKVCTSGINETKNCLFNRFDKNNSLQDYEDILPFEVTPNCLQCKEIRLKEDFRNQNVLSRKGNWNNLHQTLPTMSHGMSESDSSSVDDSVTPVQKIQFKSSLKHPAKSSKSKFSSKNSETCAYEQTKIASTTNPSPNSPISDKQTGSGETSMELGTSRTLSESTTSMTLKRSHGKTVLGSPPCVPSKKAKLETINSEMANDDDWPVLVPCKSCKTPKKKVNTWLNPRSGSKKKNNFIDLTDDMYVRDPVTVGSFPNTVRNFDAGKLHQELMSKFNDPGPSEIATSTTADSNSVLAHSCSLQSLEADAQSQTSPWLFQSQKGTDPMVAEPTSSSSLETMGLLEMSSSPRENISIRDQGGTKPNDTIPAVQELSTEEANQEFKQIDIPMPDTDSSVGQNTAGNYYGNSHLKDAANHCFDNVSQTSSAQSQNAVMDKHFLMTESNTLQSDSDVLECSACSTPRVEHKCVSCSAGHIICKSCVDEEIQSVMLSKVKMGLLCTAESCQEQLCLTSLEQIVDEFLLGLLRKNIQQKELEISTNAIKKMDGLVSCPSCNYSGLVDNGQYEFVCGNYNCTMRCCRYCKSKWTKKHDYEICCLLSSVGTECLNDITVLPLNWENADIVCDDFQVKIDPTSHEAIRWRTYFKKTNPRVKNIVGLWRIQNRRLWERYVLKRKHMVEELGIENIQEKALFHGTRYENINLICNEGFDFRVQAANGNSLGKGIYFSQSAAYSQTYACPRKHMFIARVLCGQWIDGNQSLTRPPHNPSGRMFDSCVDNIESPTMYTVFDNTQCYPEILLQFS
ncbi:unnamed protein product [Lymnaea stagnalis]|uniref:Poly [ADP-ribose] polymerase n=1 Tax=Lymnaea stagnalis TaxID=6523 RepID=A0AAV2H905_LYMST